MAISEPNFSIDADSVQEDEWVIFLKIFANCVSPSIKDGRNGIMEDETIFIV